MTTSSTVNKKSTRFTTSKESCTRALELLTNIIAGKNINLATKKFVDNPVQRISVCQQMAMNEYKQALSDSRAGELGKIFSATGRKLDALDAIGVLGQLVNEIEDWSND